MNLAEIRAGLERCIRELEESVRVLTELHGPRAGAMRDPHGRLILGDIYAALGQSYAALAGLSRTPRTTRS